MGHLYGVMRQWRWLLSLFVCRRAWLRSDRSRRYLRARLSADGRSARVRHHPAAEKDRAHQHDRQVEERLSLTDRIEALALQVDAHLSGHVRRVAAPAGEVAYEVEPAALLSVCRALRDTPELKFEML